MMKLNNGFNNLKTNKMTAVEWLESKLKNVEYNPLEKNGYLIAEEKLFNQAKEMEKQQIIDAYIEGYSAIDYNVDSEQYYNETFNK